MLRRNKYYCYLRRKDNSFIRIGKVIFLTHYLPIKPENYTRVAFFNNRVGKTFKCRKIVELYKALNKKGG